MRPPIQQRSIALCIVLSIITLGIYGLYWVYKIVEDTNTLLERPEATSGGIVIILTIVTCGIYFMYWSYITGQGFDEYIVQKENGVSGSRGILYLLLSIFGLSIITYALIQNELNQRATV
ncbi:MAG TPA: hypothetical protein DCP06_02075 [Lachnospiraceae bacterium]|nr:hypothetical protein [Lachnospiraceae bacterium]